ncbi:MAG: maleylpyruvate isomerase N-terminal domain-containing protein [Anaerolineae bacterium]|nr:maleylpyruvate isomerase N-terminal domain-containing protein [Anaerolineae bacterium]
MNAYDILLYGHKTVLDTVDGLEDIQWLIGGVCGIWSVKEIISHLASYEKLLVDILGNLLEPQPTPTLDRMLKHGPYGFNDIEVKERAGQDAAAAWAEYQETHAQTLPLINQIPLETQRQKGVLTWYGEAYDLEDFLVYTYYGHKREHCAQIAVFRDKKQ